MRLAVAGLAHAHVTYALDELSHWPDATLVGVSESESTLIQKYASRINQVPVYDSLSELLAEQSDIDVVVIAGIYSTRAADVVSALGAGAHVLSDKPLCTDLDQLAMIRAAADAAKGHVSIMFEKRYYPTSIALKGLIDSGTLGTISLIAATGPHKLNFASRPAWFFERSGYGGIAGDLPVHDIDMSLWLTGAQDGFVSAIAGNSRVSTHPDFSDYTALLMRAGQAAVTIEANWLSPEAAELHGHYRMRVTGSEGTAEIDLGYNTLRIATHDNDWHEMELPAGLRPAEAFFGAWAKGQIPDVTTQQSLLATEIALLAQESADASGALRTWTA